MTPQDQIAQWFEQYNTQNATACQQAGLNGLYEPIHYTMSQQGKRLRPLLMLCANRLFDGNPEEVRHAAIAIELFHNFTLLHDDLMDRSPLRRGMPTVYYKWNANTAILSGDTMLSLAWRQILAQPHPNLHMVLQCFNDTAIMIYEGQQYDMDFESRHDVTIAEYEEMIRLKTAVLLAAALKIGALYANAPASDIDLIYQAGIHTGLAFQLQDDLLDAYGDTSTLGKQTAQDIRDNKKTYLYLKALNTANPSQKKTLEEIFKKNTEKNDSDIQQVLDIYARLNIRDLTEQAIQQHTDKAIELINKINTPEERKVDLNSVILGLLHRDK